MALKAGDSLGRFQVIGPLGSGGMGTVYRARDIDLGRDVALKVLSDRHRFDALRVERFKREARMLAALNHPGISTLFDVEVENGVHALVMELVEGRTVADLVAGGRALPMKRALEIARNAAEALEAAHDHGVVHRDLKPANIMVRSDGAVKVLDFGLAKMFEPEAAPPPDGLTESLITVTEVIGTPAYMSPEQARGARVDRQTDVWAFGCVLYEMITGRRAFDGPTTSDILARVLEREPDFDALPAGTPDSVRQLLRRALAKDAQNRLHAIGDARLELVEALAGPTLARGSAESAPSFRVPVRHRRALALAATVVVIALAIVGTLGHPPVVAPPVARFELALPESAPLLSGGEIPQVGVALDGAHIVYPTNRGLAVRSRDNLDVRVIETGFSAGAFFSPDGQWIGYIGDGLRKVPVNGGVSTALAPVGPGASATWGDDGLIVADAKGLFRVPSEGGTPERLPGGSLSETEQAAYPEILPGGSVVLISVIPDTHEHAAALLPRPTSRIEALDLRTGSRKIVVPAGGRPRYVPTGHLVYGSGESIMAVAFDANRLETRGHPIQIAPQGADNFAVSNEGTLTYVAGNSPHQRRLVWVDRRGRETELGAPPAEYIFPRLSPDGTRVALDIGGPNRDIWTWDIERKLLERFTLDPAEDALPQWNRDGTRLVWASTRHGVPNIFIQAADRSGSPERLMESAHLQHPSTFAPDGRLLFGEQIPNRGLRDLMALSLDTRRVAPVIATDAGEGDAAVSPGGEWIAYTSDESGSFEVYVRPYPNTDGGQRKISTHGGRQSVWSRTGGELFYRDFGGAIIAVPVTLGERLSLGEPETILPANPGYRGAGAALSARSYDVSPDGSRFLMIKLGDASRPPSIVVVQNWFEELKARASSR